MSTKWLMIASVFVLGATGLVLTFLPQEVATRFGGEDGITALSLQLLGATFLGFAMLNWMARESLLGGIYGRPIVVGNLVQFFTAGMALIRSSVAQPSPVVVSMAAIWGVMAAAFGSLLFRSPVRPHSRE